MQTELLNVFLWFLLFFPFGTSTGGRGVAPDWVCHERPVVCQPQSQHEDGHRRVQPDCWWWPGCVIRQPQVSEGTDSETQWRQMVQLLIVFQWFFSAAPMALVGECITSPKRLTYPGSSHTRAGVSAHIHTRSTHMSFLSQGWIFHSSSCQPGVMTLTCVWLMWSMMSTPWPTLSRPRTVFQPLLTNYMVKSEIFHNSTHCPDHLISVLHLVVLTCGNFHRPWCRPQSWPAGQVQTVLLGDRHHAWKYCFTS